MKRKPTINALLLSLILMCASFTACSQGESQNQSTADTSDSSQVIDTETGNNSNNSSSSDNNSDSPPTKQIEVKVFFPRKPNSDEDFRYVEQVSRTTDNVGVAKFAIEQLIIGPTEQEAQIGLIEALQLKGKSNCGRDFTVGIKEGIAKLQFCRSIPSSGVGYDARAISAIEATLKQFDSVKSVVILNRDGNCFGDLSGENLCLQTMDKNAEKLSKKSKVATNGIGPIVVGMTVEEAAFAGGVEFRQQPSGGEEYGCLMYKPEGFDKLWFMVTNGSIARVDVSTQEITTFSGAKVGDSEAKIKSLYPGKIETEPHKYVPDGNYLTFVPKDKADKNYRVIFETDAQGKVTSFRAGKLPEVQYVEGCA